MNKNKSFQLAMGISCNNNCIFCNDKSNYNSRRQEFSLQNYQSLIKMNARYYDNICFTSGEPTLNKNFLKLVNYSKHIGYKQIRLITNGRMLYYKWYVNKIIKAGVNDIGISLHGSNKEIHSKITRSQNSFKQTIKGILNTSELIKQNKIKFSIHTTLIKSNLIDIPNILNLINKMYIDEWIINYYHPLTQNKKFVEFLLPKFSDSHKIISKLTQLNQKGKNITIRLIDFPICIFTNASSKIGSIENFKLQDTIGNHYSKEEMFSNRKRTNATCQNCQMINKCEGFPDIYKEIYSDSELKPF